jgi:hypothetical protein
MPFVPTLGSSGYWISSSGANALPTGIQLRPNVAPRQLCFNSAWSVSKRVRRAVPELDAFPMPGSLGNPQFGDAPRTMTNCRSPWMTTLNASLSKKINITERVYAQLQVDVLNAANHPLFFFNPNTGFKAYNSFNTASLTNECVGAGVHEPINVRDCESAQLGADVAGGAGEYPAVLVGGGAVAIKRREVGLHGAMRIPSGGPTIHPEWHDDE